MKRRGKTTKTDNTWQKRYLEAHHDDFKMKHPVAFADGHYCKPTMPKVSTANGLTNAICNYINWMGGIGNRINVSGRLVEGAEKTVSGAYVTKKKFIKSSTLKGTADITAQLPNGKVIFIEIKVGNDKPREKQLEMQAKVRRSNGCYEFISSLEQFYQLYDNIMNSVLF